MGAYRNYVGARYVPKVSDPAEWSQDANYDRLEIVQYNNLLYLSKTEIKSGGNAPDNNSDWIVIVNYKQPEQINTDDMIIEKALNASSAPMLTPLVGQTIPASGKLTYSLLQNIKLKTPLHLKTSNSLLNNIMNNNLTISSNVKINDGIYLCTVRCGWNSSMMASQTQTYYNITMQANDIIIVSVDPSVTSDVEITDDIVSNIENRLLYYFVYDTTPNFLCRKGDILE